MYTRFLIGVTGFEPATSASRTQRSTKLSHTPLLNFYAAFFPERRSRLRLGRFASCGPLDHAHLYQTEPHAVIIKLLYVVGFEPASRLRLGRFAPCGPPDHAHLFVPRAALERDKPHAVITTTYQFYNARGELSREFNSDILKKCVVC